VFRGKPWRDWCSFITKEEEEEALGRVWGVVVIPIPESQDGEQDIFLVIQQYTHVGPDSYEAPDGMLPSSSVAWPLMHRSGWRVIRPDEVSDGAYVLPAIQEGEEVGSGSSAPDFVFWLCRSLYSSLADSPADV
jgi:hypothetical protein